jgi:3-oxoacyl-[acyl-carrier-protein] synthase III
VGTASTQISDRGDRRREDPIGSFGGAVKDVPAYELGTTAAKAALGRAEVPGEDIDEVVMGCIGQVGPDAYNARRVALAAGLPESTPAYTVNRLCGSGLQAVWSAAQQMRWGGVNFALAGGDESMSRMPFYDFGARSGYKFGDRSLVDGTVAILTDPFGGVHMGRTAEDGQPVIHCRSLVGGQGVALAGVVSSAPDLVRGRLSLTADSRDRPRPKSARSITN